MYDLLQFVKQEGHGCQAAGVTHGGPSVSRMTFICASYLWVWERLCRSILDLQSRAQTGHWKFAFVAGIEAAKWRRSLADCA